MNDLSEKINAPLLAAIERIAKPAPSPVKAAEDMLNRMDMTPQVAAELFEVVGLGLADWCEREKVSERDLFANLATLRRDVLEIGTGSR